MKASIIEEVAFQLIKRASIVLPKDVKVTLQKAYEGETSKLGKTQLKAILDNVAVAEQMGRLVCQDIGIVSFFIKGRSLDYKNFEEALRRATIRATREVPLRPNAVYPLTRKNSEDNTGAHILGITHIYEDADRIDLVLH
jgi:fumarate hydratase subunit alpha